MLLVWKGLSQTFQGPSLITPAKKKKKEIIIAIVKLNYPISHIIIHENPKYSLSLSTKNQNWKLIFCFPSSCHASPCQS